MSTLGELPEEQSRIPKDLVLSYRIDADGDNYTLTPKRAPNHICDRPQVQYRVSSHALDAIIGSARNKGVTLTISDIINALAKIPPDKWIYAEVAESLIAEKMPKLTLPVTPELVKWLANGDRGSSSNAVFTHMTGVCAVKDQVDKTFAPMDPDDMSRCLKLIDIGGKTWRDNIPSLAKLSPQWETIVARWDKLEEITRSWMSDNFCYSLKQKLHGFWRDAIKANL